MLSCPGATAIGMLGIIFFDYGVSSIEAGILFPFGRKKNQAAGEEYSKRQLCTHVMNGTMRVCLQRLVSSGHGAKLVPPPIACS